MLFVLHQSLWCGLLLTAATVAGEAAFALKLRIQAPTISDTITADTVTYNTLSRRRAHGSSIFPAHNRPNPIPCRW